MCYWRLHRSFGSHYLRQSIVLHKMDLISFKWQRTTATTTGWKVLRSSLLPNIIYIPVVVFYWNNRWTKKNIMCNKSNLLVENAHTMFLTLLKNFVFLTKNNPCCTIINRLLHKTFYQPFFKFIKTIFTMKNTKISPQYSLQSFLS